LRSGVDGAALLQDGEIVAVVTISGGHEADAAVLVLEVVPADEGGHPLTGVLDGGKSVARVRWTVLHRPEQRLGERVVVGHARPAERRDDAEPLEGGEHGRALHGGTIVGVQHPASQVDRRMSLGPDAVDECARQLRRLLRVYLPAKDLAAPYVEDEVQEEELTAHMALEIGDVPRGHLPRSGCDVLARAVGRRARRASAVLHVLVVEHSVDGRLRGDVLAAIRERRHELLGGRVPKLGTGRDLDDASPLFVG